MSDRLDISSEALKRFNQAVVDGVLQVTDIEELVIAAAKRGADEAIANHKCNIPAKYIDGIGEILGVIETVGEGDFSKGSQRIRANSEYVRKLRGTGRKISTAIITTTVTIIVAFICGAVALGIKEYFIK